MTAHSQPAPASSPVDVGYDNTSVRVLQGGMGKKSGGQVANGIVQDDFFAAGAVVCRGAGAAEGGAALVRQREGTVVQEGKGGHGVGLPGPVNAGAGLDNAGGHFFPAEGTFHWHRDTSIIIRLARL